MTFLFYLLILAVTRDTVYHDVSGVNGGLLTNLRGWGVVQINNDISREYDNFIEIEKETNTTEGINENLPLILTPLIEHGLIEEARNASRVEPELFLGFESYSGFLTVNSTFKSHLYFWYFPSLTKPVNETPWIIWLQGGPGSSSMTGLFEEIGPFRGDSDGTLNKNPYTWLMNHSLVFIDNPVGTGFSFTEHDDGYVKDMDTYGKHLHTAVKQLVQVYPELRVAPLYVAGESYAGKYVPALGMEIHKHKDAPGCGINLQGFMIGNGLVEPDMLLHPERAFYQFGLVEKYQIEEIQPLIDKFHIAVAAGNSYDSERIRAQIVHILKYLSDQRTPFNFLHDSPLEKRYEAFLGRAEVRRALHVGDRACLIMNPAVRAHLMCKDFLSSGRPLFETLLEHYRVLAYCGQLDLMLSCGVSSEVFRTWKWNSSRSFTEATRGTFYHSDNGTVAGYVTSGGGLTWAVVRGAGHLAPRDAPAAALSLVTQWIRGDLTFMARKVPESRQILIQFKLNTKNC